jgi:hypothetical protein
MYCFNIHPVKWVSRHLSIAPPQVSVEEDNHKVQMIKWFPV